MMKLHTNEGEFYVFASDNQLRKAMSAYIKAKRAKGWSVASIMFAWHPVRVTSLSTIQSKA